MRNENLHPVFRGIFENHEAAVSAASAKTAYADSVQQEVLSEERLRADMPKLLSALDEFRAVVREFRESGKLEHKNMGAAFDKLDGIVRGAVERRRDQRS